MKEKWQSYRTEIIYPSKIMADNLYSSQESKDMDFRDGEGLLGYMRRKNQENHDKWDNLTQEEKNHAFLDLCNKVDADNRKADDYMRERYDRYDSMWEPHYKKMTPDELYKLSFIKYHDANKLPVGLQVLNDWNDFYKGLQVKYGVKDQK